MAATLLWHPAGVNSFIYMMWWRARQGRYQGFKVCAGRLTGVRSVANVTLGLCDVAVFCLGREEKSLEAFTVSNTSNTICFYGNGGTMILVSAKSGQYIGELKMNGSVKGAQFSADGTQLISASRKPLR